MSLFEDLLHITSKYLLEMNPQYVDDDFVRGHLPTRDGGTPKNWMV